MAVLGAGSAGAEPAIVPTEQPIARFEGEPIYLQDVEPNVALEIWKKKIDIYTLLKHETEELVARRLVEAEAKRRGITVDELLEREVNAKAPPYTEAELDAWIAEHPEEAQGGDPRIRARLHTYLSETRRIERRLAFLKQLQAGADFEFLLQPPERPRTHLAVDFAPARGPEDAPVTLIHFASFGCSRCARSAQDLQRLMAEFPGQIRWIHVNFFNVFDETSLRAAELALAAQDEGRFWEFHDLVFSLGGDLDPDKLDALAKEHEFAVEARAEGTLESTYLRRVQRDLQVAQKAGVSSIPVVFVNGRYHSGTFPFEQLRAMVAEELTTANDKIVTAPD